MGREIIHIEGLLNDTSNIIEQAKRTAYTAVNVTLVARNWLLGKRIAEEDMHGNQRAEYGKQVILKLSKQLTEKYGEGFGTTNLRHFVDFSKKYPALFRLDSSVAAICHSASGESHSEIVHLLSGEFENIFKHVVPTTPIRINWTHYRILLQEDNDDARAWYEREAAEQAWNVKTLQRNVSSQYYYRLLQSPKREKVEDEMQKLTAPLHDNDQLFAAKYLTYMPTKEELRREIEQQKQIFEMKQKSATKRHSFDDKEDEE